MGSHGHADGAKAALEQLQEQFVELTEAFATISADALALTSPVSLIPMSHKIGCDALEWGKCAKKFAYLGRL